MSKPRRSTDEAFAAFVRQVWTHDVSPLLRDRMASQRRTTARVGGSLAGATGLMLDKLFKLRGKPFGRAMTVLGSSFGAMLPDVWSWAWLAAEADAEQRRVVEEQLRAKASAMPFAVQLELLDLDPTATREQLKEAWRREAARWHPDRAASAEAKAEHQARFITIKAAYERLCLAFDSGELPIVARE
ncbi:MAG: J domain-containing protein [Phycisphaerae bacterium]